MLPWETYQALERERQQSEQYAAFEREVAAFERMKEELLARYKGRWVAIAGGQVAEVGDDKLEVLEKVRQRLGVAEKEPVYLYAIF